MKTDSNLVAILKTAVAEHIAATYQKEAQIFDDGAGLLFVTVRQSRMTDSFKLVVCYKGKSGFHVEIAGKCDIDPSRDFHFPTLETAAAAYMSIFTFFSDRVLTRVSDI